MRRQLPVRACRTWQIDSMLMMLSELRGLMPSREATSETQKRQSRWRVRSDSSLLSMAFWLLLVQIPEA